MKRCTKCGRESHDDDRFCDYCGERFKDVNAQSKHSHDSEPEILYEDPKINFHNSNGTINCPNCGSQDVYLLTRETNGFSESNACCGFLIFGPLGLLCGLSGDRESATVRKCKNCGQEF